jgi:carboxyl-terminal processing protease
MRKGGACFFECLTFTLALNLSCLSQQSPRQHISSFDRDRTISMLEMVAGDVKKHYYDPKFHGLDWDARVQEAKHKIETSSSLNEAFTHIAGALDALSDSHTFFTPPPRPYKHDYGFQMQIVGDHCFVTRVRPQSDGESKGLKPGDEVLAVNGYTPNRDSLWKMLYVYNVLRPQTALRLYLRDPSGNTRQLNIVAKMRDTTHVKEFNTNFGDMVRDSEDAYQLTRPHSVEVGDLMILKLPVFFFSDLEATEMIGKARKQSKALIIDLRSNPGGAVDSLKSLLALIFANDIKIGDRVQRGGDKPLVAKSHRSPFSGKIVVLVDSKSASASELFARIIQIEKRGAVLGDTSAGAVMEARRYTYKSGLGVVTYFAASITDADLVMSDAKSLEHVGVTPDEIIIPNAADLANGRDPVMARAAEMLGFKITADDAGKFFPYQWPKE